MPDPDTLKVAKEAFFAATDRLLEAAEDLQHHRNYLYRLANAESDTDESRKGGA